MSNDRTGTSEKNTLYLYTVLLYLKVNFCHFSWHHQNWCGSKSESSNLLCDQKFYHMHCTQMTFYPNESLQCVLPGFCLMCKIFHIGRIESLLFLCDSSCVWCAGLGGKIFFRTVHNQFSFSQVFGAFLSLLFHLFLSTFYYDVKIWYICRLYKI